jgi:UDP-N-acetylmuramate--alanine ligase
MKPAPLPDLTGVPVHLIGIGGAGMCGAAKLCVEAGARVSGSDLGRFEGLGELVSAGVRVSIGHRRELLDHDVSLVICSAAIPPTNPELDEATRRGVPVLKYAEFLGALMARRDGVAVAGTHGKSTTTAMTTHVFREARLDPTYVVGARSTQLCGSAAMGCGPHMIVEACEFDRSFLHLWPGSAVILNLEADHLDCYRSLDAIVEAFGAFASNVRPDGVVVCNAEDRWACAAARMGSAPVETFGFESGADWRAVHLTSDRGRYAFDVLHRGMPYMTARLSVPGRHNVANALAVIALAHHADADREDVVRGLEQFAGVDRRMTWRGQRSGINIVDDYAHHPTEIRATIEAARFCFEPTRTWVVFQPHQCGRTRDFMDEFAMSFDHVDEVIVPAVYGARESDARACCERAMELVDRMLQNGRRARFVASLDEVAGAMLEELADGDLVVTMGAGDVWKVADELVARIR